MVRRCMLGVFLAALILGSSGVEKARAETSSPSSLERYALRNGLRVVLAPDASVAGVYVVVRYDVGSANEPVDYRGISHLLEHLTFRGSRHLRPLEGTAILQRQGAEFNAVTSLETTTYYTQIRAAGLESVLWLESERMAFTLDGLSPAALAVEQRVVVNELRERGRNLERLLARYWFRELYGDGHPFAPGENEGADVQAATLPMLQWFFQAGYRPDNATLVVAGDFDRSSARALVEKYFGSIVAPATKRTSVRIDPPKLCGVHRLEIGHNNLFGRFMRVGWPLPAARGATDRVSVRLLAETFERRLERELVKEKSQVSALRVELSEHTSHSLLSVNLRLPEGADARIVENDVLRVARNLGTEGAGAGELKSVRAGLFSQAVFEREDGLERTLSLATGDDPDRDAQALLSTTAADVRRVAQPLVGPVLSVLLKRSARRTGEIRVERRENPCQ